MISKHWKKVTSKEVGFSLIDMSEENFAKVATYLVEHEQEIAFDVGQMILKIGGLAPKTAQGTFHLQKTNSEK